MKNLILFTFALFVCCVKNMNGQAVAGDIPNGMMVTNPNMSLSVSQIYNSEEDSLDINCDGTFDIKFKLTKGPTVVDGPNMLEMMVLNSTFSFCNYQGSYAQLMKFYNAGDTMNCVVDSTWSNDTILLGDYGCMVCFETPTVVNNRYIAYNKDSSDYGWIKLSYNLQDAGSSTTPITFTLHEVVSVCGVSSIAENNLNHHIKVATLDASTLGLIGLKETTAYQIIAMDGTVVVNAKTSAMIDISNLPQGVWILKIAGVARPSKFIKQ